MIKYNKLITVVGNSYSIRTDLITDLSSLFINLTDINTTLVLVLESGPDTHTLDLGKLLLNNIELLESKDILELITKLTPLMIYTYKTLLFSKRRMIRSFTSSDLLGDVIISPCNLTTGETSHSTYDPNYSDAVISCENYDLSKVIPVIKGKLRNCKWYNKKIYLENKVDLVRDEGTDVITFVSFGDTEVTLQSLNEVRTNDWKVPEGYVIILVLGGCLFYNNPYYFLVDHRRNKLTLNSCGILERFKERNYNDVSEVIDDPDSFIIMIESNRLLVRDVLIIPVKEEDETTLEFVYFEEGTQETNIDYVCIDNVDDTVRGISSFPSKYKNTKTKEVSKEHRIYAEGGSGNMRLVQLAVS